LREWVGKVEAMMEREGGLDELIGMVDGERGTGNGMLARPRKMEVEMAVNRLVSEIPRSRRRVSNEN